MKVTLKEVDVARINLRPGEILAVTIKSDQIDEIIIDAFKKALKPAFPQNEVLIIGISPDEEVLFSTLKSLDVAKAECNTASYCSDCSCGKKEQIEASKYDL